MAKKPSSGLAIRVGPALFRMEPKGEFAFTEAILLKGTFIKSCQMTS